MNLQARRIMFLEENMEEISDLYNAIGKISWTPTFVMPKFSKFVYQFAELCIPDENAKKKHEEKVYVDWLDEEAQRNSIEIEVEDEGEDESEKKM